MSENGEIYQNILFLQLHFYNHLIVNSYFVENQTSNARGGEFAELAAVSNLQICFHQRQILCPIPSFPSNLVTRDKFLMHYSGPWAW